MEIFYNSHSPGYEEIVSYGPKWWTEYKEMDAGVFNVNLNNPRSNSNTNIGFRSALPSYARIGNSKDYRQCEGIKEPVSTPAEKQEKNGAMLMAFCRCGIGCGGCQYL